MKIEYELANALKEMMCSTPLDSISVTSLTNRCGVNRKTFYYHFHNVYDLLTLVFLNEDIPGANKCKNTNELLKEIYHYYEKNKQFIDATLISAGKDLFLEFINNICFKNIMRFINLYECSNNISALEKKAIVRFYASAIANIVVYYFSTHKNSSLNGLMLRVSFLPKDYLSDACKNILKNKINKERN